MTSNNKEWVIIFSSLNTIHAGIVRGYLETNGIEARVIDVHSNSLQIPMSIAIGGVKVQVPRDHEEEAAKLLAELEVYEMKGKSENSYGRSWLSLYAIMATLTAIVLAALFFSGS